MPVLTQEEEAAIRLLENPGLGIPAKALADLAERFARFRSLFVRVTSSPTTEVYEGEVVLMGLLNQAYNYLLGGALQLSAGNPHVWSACVRGLYGTFGALAYLNEYPQRITSFVEPGISAGKLRNAAKRRQPTLGPDLEKLDRLVHPAVLAIHAGFRPVEEVERHADFRMGPQPPRPKEAREGMSVLVRMSGMVVSEMIGLVQSHSESLQMGKVVLEKVCG